MLVGPPTSVGLHSVCLVLYRTTPVGLYSVCLVTIIVYRTTLVDLYSVCLVTMIVYRTTLVGLYSVCLVTMIVYRTTLVGLYSVCLVPNACLQDHISGPVEYIHNYNPLCTGVGEETLIHGLKLRFIFTQESFH